MFNYPSDRKNTTAIASERIEIAQPMYETIFNASIAAISVLLCNRYENQGIMHTIVHSETIIFKVAWLA